MKDESVQKEPRFEPVDPDYIREESVDTWALLSEQIKVQNESRPSRIPSFRKGYGAVCGVFGRERALRVITALLVFVYFINQENFGWSSPFRGTLIDGVIPAFSLLIVCPFVLAVTVFKRSYLPVYVLFVISVIKALVYQQAGATLMFVVLFWFLVGVFALKGKIVRGSDEI
jgi:hypothetical protein